MGKTAEFKHSKILFLYTEIGRGHPSYLDGIVKALSKSGQTDFSVTDVYALSSGISLWTWKLIRWLYQFGSQGGLITALYSGLRQFLGSNDSTGFLVNLLGRDIKKKLVDFRGYIVVAHPILAGMLAPSHEVIYQHGEFAVPNEALVKDCVKILVPGKNASQKFLKANTAAETVIITGQCVETELLAKAEQAMRDRTKRLKKKKNVTVGLFSSGAYPRVHTNQLIKISAALAEQAHEVFLFTGESEAFYHSARRHFKKTGLLFTESIEDKIKVHIICSKSRGKQNEDVAAIFGKLDFFISPAHERIHWAMGLGLPLYMLSPHIGTFAPQNARIAVRAGVAHLIDTRSSTDDFMATIKLHLQNGTLLEMSENGYRPKRTLGFACCADEINYF